jgi:hypothetical protein
MNSVESTLITLGIACVAAAIIGGGFKALGVEIPALQSPIRQTALGVLGLVLVLVAAAPSLVRQVGEAAASASQAARTTTLVPSGAARATPAQSRQSDTSSTQNPTSITPGGPSVTLTFSSPGQRTTLAFDGEEGQIISGRFTNFTGDLAKTGIGPPAMRLYLYKPDRTALISDSAIWPSGSIRTTTLPVSGRYEITVHGWAGDEKGTAMLTLYDGPL